MPEHLFRAHANRLHIIYDRMPSAVQTAMTSTRGWFLKRMRYQPETHALVTRLRHNEERGWESMRDFQVGKISEIVDSAIRNVPYYRDYPKTKFAAPEDIRRLPVLRRDAVCKNAMRLVTTAKSRWPIIKVSTTGTTGGAIPIFYNARVARTNWAFRMRQWQWLGYAPGDPRLTFFGSRVVPPERAKPPYWVNNYPERQTLLSIFHLSKDAAPHYIRFLCEHENQIVEGFPSVLGILADFILDTGKPIPMKMVLTDGEPVYPFVRRKIEAAFNTQLFDCYGNTEFAGLIQECEYHRMHLISDYAYLEVLDDNDQPLPPGQEGYLVWTGFVNDVMPLIRYRIGDRGMIEDASCECGRPFPVASPGITRESDLLSCPDGRILSPRALNQSLKGISAFRFCQFIQTEPDVIVVRAVPNKADAGCEIAGVRFALQSLLGTQMTIRAELAKEPITRSGGKIPLIINGVKI